LPRVALRSVWKENGVTSAKGTKLFVIVGTGLIPWPTGSMDYIPRDFCLWGHVKTRYSNLRYDIAFEIEIHRRLSTSISQWRRTCEEFEYCVDVWRVTIGPKTEHL
jgi:hypothetical protein